jgi:hypothetical protein
MQLTAQGWVGSRGDSPAGVPVKLIARGEIE